MGTLRASGSVNFKAEGWDDDDNDEGSSYTQIMSYSLSGLDPTCSTAAVAGVENACGFHLHEGQDCSNATLVGGHFYNLATVADDPWANIAYRAMGGKAVAGVSVATGLLINRGDRVACSPVRVVPQPILRADAYVRFPFYDGPYVTTGSVVFDKLGKKADGVQGLSYNLSGIDPTCGQADIMGVADACGITLHVGTDCSTVSRIGGYYWNQATSRVNPWINVMYTAFAHLIHADTSAVAVPVQTCLTLQDLTGRVLVIHDAKGAGIACSPIQ
ncbi:unnamed protein product [Polarella glacialis]|uniref:Uncharacterized protein n=1 Tax=Polarella glacialis TaxID=89957 RepID=A0A813IGX2_POLGL|nr:unnamed protein product [Polarella glacialis]CAE8652736.1 unnamed protein product [Polarella glacialis]